MGRVLVRPIILRPSGRSSSGLELLGLRDRGRAARREGAGVSAEARDVEGDGRDGNDEYLGDREVDGGCFGGGSAVAPGDLAGRAASLLCRARVMVRNRRQAEECEQGGENDDRLARAEQALERAKRTGASRHGRRG